MKNINKPSFEIKNFYNNFCEQMRKSDLKDKFQRLSSKMILEERRLATFAKSFRAHQYVLTDYNIGEQLNKNEADILFERFKKSIATTDVRKELSIILNGSKCIYCEKRDGNETLDHILPKSIYTFLAVTPTNLVACCSKCNSKKLDFIDGIVHSYFESFNQYHFIKCNVAVKSIGNEFILNVNYVFSPFGKTGYEKDLSERLEKMVERLDLLNRYTIYCENEMLDYVQDWQQDCGEGMDQLLKQLTREMNRVQRSFSVNSYQVSFYRAFIDNIKSGSITLDDILKISCNDSLI